MKIRFLILSAALLGAGSTAMADVQLNAGGVYARGEDEESFGFELGAGFYFKHTTSSLASGLGITYLNISSIEDNGTSLDVDAGYDVLGLDYRLYFPLIQEDVLQLYIEGLAGSANTDVEAKISNMHFSAEEWGFAWGLGAGLQWNIIPNFGLNLGYTYLGLQSPEVDDGREVGNDSLHLIRLNAIFRF